MVWPLVIGAAIGAAKQYGDQKEAARQRDVQAQIARFSPWTGMGANSSIANPNAVQNVGGGLLAGMQMQQSMNAADQAQKTAAAQEAASAAQTNYYDSLPRGGQYDPSGAGNYNPVGRYNPGRISTYVQR